MKIKNTQKLYDEICNPEARKMLMDETGISPQETEPLTKLCDLSRIKWVGAQFANMLYEPGYDTTEKIAQANPELLHKQVNDILK